MGERMKRGRTTKRGSDEKGDEKGDENKEKEKGGIGAIAKKVRLVGWLVGWLCVRFCLCCVLTVLPLFSLFRVLLSVFGHSMCTRVIFFLYPMYLADWGVQGKKKRGEGRRTEDG